MPLPDAANVAAPPAYCRRCGYALCGLAGGRCPECGGVFDLADRRTFARRPPRLRLRWWAWRVGVGLVVLGLAAACVPAWYWYGWRAEQRSIDGLRRLGGSVGVKRVEAAGVGRYLPGRWAFLGDRASGVFVAGLTAEQAGRVDLRPLARLRHVELPGSSLGDPVLARLRGLAELEVLDLSGNPLDGSGLAHLGACRRLHTLRLAHSRLSDAGLAHVGRLTSLRQLAIDQTAVTDAGVAHLAGLTSLEHLFVRNTAVTEVGLLRLRGLTSLRYVWVTGAGVTGQGRDVLQAAMPNVMFIY